MNEDILLRIIIKITLPFILIYGFYVQIHGELSPGGGFQAGSIIASGFILYLLDQDIKDNIKSKYIDILQIFACLGVLIYGITGFYSMILGLDYLDYSYLSAKSQTAEKLGIMLVEIGVGITVFSVMLIIFLSFSLKKIND